VWYKNPELLDMMSAYYISPIYQDMTFQKYVLEKDIKVCSKLGE